MKKSVRRKKGGVIPYEPRGKFSGIHSEDFGSGSSGPKKQTAIGKMQPHGSFASMGIKH